MIRKASHAGTWYTADPSQLDSQLSSFLSLVNLSATPNSKAVIAPHAGYSYSGSNAAFAYKAISEDTKNFKRIFILGPSHTYYLNTCALSSCDSYETPLGTLKLDKGTMQSLRESGMFEEMRKDKEEAEHSIEMHLPYIAKLFKDCLIVPVLVGSLSKQKEESFGEIFSKYLKDSIFVISSDFCHWGSRFDYFYLPDSPSPHSATISERIEMLDKEAMGLIEKLDADGFLEYLKRTGNTICGRHPISILLRALNYYRSIEVTDFSLKFLKYDQSSPKIKSKRDTSVSYASAVVEMK